MLILYCPYVFFNHAFEPKFTNNRGSFVHYPSSVGWLAGCLLGGAGSILDWCWVLDISVRAWPEVLPGFESEGGTYSTGFPRIWGVLRFLAVVE
ncbi:hypothetical protein Hanom_Chr16g01464631 [Helianthus anomalus]